MTLISVGQIIDQSWEHYRTNFKKIMMVSGWLLIPFLVSLIALTLYPEASSMLAGKSQAWYETGSVFLWILNNSLIAPIIGLWVFIMLVMFFAKDLNNEKTELQKISKGAWRLFFPMIVVNVLVALILISAWLLLIPGIAINWLGAIMDNGYVAGFGTLVLTVGLVAAVFFCVRWVIDFYFASYALATEGVTGKKALTRSKELTKGRRFAVVLRVLLPKLVFVIILAVLQSLSGYIMIYFVALLAGFDADLVAKINSIGSSLIVALASVLGTPILVLADYIIFDSLRQTLKK